MWAPHEENREPLPRGAHVPISVDVRLLWFQLPVSLLAATRSTDPVPDGSEGRGRGVE